MSKRFTDTDKWKKAWYRKLGSVMRDVWNYLLDECDSAGVWEIDMEVLSFFIGEEISIDKMIEAFGDRIILLPDNKIFIPGFIDFQYGELNEECKPHLSVIKRLINLGIYEGYLNCSLTLSEGSPKGSLTLEDKDKDKEEDKEKEKEKGGMGENKKLKTPIFDFNAIYQEYPLKEGKQLGLAACKAQIKTQEAYDQLLAAVRRYRDKCEIAGTEKGYIKHFSTFMSKGRWKDYLDEDNGSAIEVSPSSHIDWSKFT